MAESKPIVCPCGRLLGRTINNSGGGTKVCPSCKKKVRYDCSKDVVYTTYA